MHNLAILDMCYEYAEEDEDRQLAEQYRVFVTTHRVQARVLAYLEAEKPRRGPSRDSSGHR